MVNMYVVEVIRSKCRVKDNPIHFVTYSVNFNRMLLVLATYTAFTVKLLWSAVQYPITQLPTQR